MEDIGNKQQQGFVRLQFNTSGMTCLYCARCNQLVAYSPRAEVLAKVQAIHELRCSPVSATKQ